MDSAYRAARAGGRSYRSARPWADDLASDGGVCRNRVSSLIDAAATDDDNDAESVLLDLGRVRIEALRMLSLANNWDGSTERQQQERESDRGVAPNVCSFST